MAITKISKAMMDANSLDSDSYVDGSIDNAHIADDAIDSEHYAAGSIDEGHIADNAVTLAKMAGGTDGNIISFDASGNPVAIATGSDGQVLTSTGAGSPPAFETAAGGGKVLQVVSVTKVDTFNTGSTSFVAITGLTVNITPSATSSKVLVLWNVDTGSAAGYNGAIQLNRGGTPIGGGTAASSRPTGQFHHLTPTAATELNSAGSFLDSPSSTSTLTYNFEGLTEGSSGLYINRSTGDADHITYCRSSSSITLMEIGA